ETRARVLLRSGAYRARPQHLSLGVIHGEVSGPQRRDGRRHAEPAGVGLDDDRIPLADPESRGVLGRHHDDVAAAVPAVEVLLLVDDGVELSLGAERRQTELPRGRREGWNRRDVEMG